MIKKILLISAMVLAFSSIMFAQGYRYDERRGYDRGGYERGGCCGGGGYYR